ncbi:MAG: hypothetical protein OXB98_02210 [Bryobacterales bacterium]|nr:hypothetical protein [Bryobacterales bacterium]
MLRRTQANNFHCLRDVNLALDGSGRIMVGPNGSGKSALLDVVSFFRDSMAVLGRLADTVDVHGCRCPAFGGLKDTLRSWFLEASS